MVRFKSFKGLFIQPNLVLGAFIYVILTLLFNSAYATPFSTWLKESTWHPIVAVGLGTATSSNLGESTAFPIQNPITDQFYNYSAFHSMKTATLFNGFLGAQVGLFPDWLLETGLDYNQNSPFLARGGLVQGADVQSSDTYTYHYSIVTKQALIEGKLLYTFKQYFHPYLLLGLGAAFNKAFNYATDIPPFLTFTRMYSDHNNTSFSYAAGIGLDTDISDHLRLGIGYRFADLGKVELGNATINTTNVIGTLSQNHLYANEGLIQLTAVI